MARLDEREAWIHLALTPGLSPRAAARAVEAAGSAAAACRWPPQRFQEVGGPCASGPARRPLDVPVAACLARTEALGQRVLTPADEEWPAERFRALVDPPGALFVAGTLPAQDVLVAAVVGTRRATPYGLRVARALGEDLVRHGVCVVSGLAVGIDAAAHAGALTSGAQAPRTVAVLGCGLAVAYPPENATLREEVVGAGALVSEHAPDVPPERWHFPRRNRIVAALASVVVVVEAPEQSGALQTAALAVEAGRDVLAVPGPIDRPTHVGCLRLLAEGKARLCRGVGDVFDALGLADAARGGAYAPEPAGGGPRGLPPPGPQLALWSLLDRDEAKDADTLCLRSALPASDVAAALASLELDGRVVRIPGVGYRRA